MRAAVTEIRKYLPEKRESDYGLENALAKYVRNRWPEKTPSYVQAHFDLSESEALKVVYANASKNTLKKLLHHRRGGFALFLELLCEATGTKLEEHFEQQAEKARHERIQWEERERVAAALSARLSQRGSSARQVAYEMWGLGAEADDLGVEPQGDALAEPHHRTIKPRKTGG
jgi:hypothetical protein